MNSKVTYLLNKAKKLEDETLSEDIKALEELGDRASARKKEYKNLLNKVSAIVDKEGEVVEGETVESEKAKKLCYSSIKMIGSLYYSSKDNYATGFTSADECAEYFNGE